MARTPNLVILITAVLLLCSAVRVSASSAAPVDASLLFAGMDGAFSFQQPEIDSSSIKSELVGIIVDGRDLDAQLVYVLGESYYLPASILSDLGVQGTVRAGQLYLVTPGGEVETQPHFFRDIYGEMFFHADMLDEVLKIRWEFSKEKYAFNMTLPWWQQGVPGGEVFAQDDPDVDFNPSTFGLTQIRLDHTQFVDDNNSNGYTNLLLRGRLAEGIWRTEIIQQENRDLRAENYYWLKDFDHMQTLVGNQQVLINPLLPSIETTGAQALYSSKEIKFNPYQDQTRSQYVRRFGIPSKEIEGYAQPGAIAELRVNERPIARTRVKLDGSYRFAQVRNNSLQFQTVKVHILDQRSMVELEVENFTRTPIDLLLDKGQSVGFAGVGTNGNPLDPWRGTDGEAAFGLYRYGLSDRLTLEAGLQSANGRTHQVAGLSASFGRNWAATASLGNHEGANGYSTDLYGRGERWLLSARVQNYGEGFRTPLSEESTFNELRYEYWLTTRLSVGMHGRSTKTANRDEDYLLPGFTWRFNRRNILRVWPDYDGSYRFDLRTAHRERDWFEFVHDSAGNRAEYRYFQTPQLEFFGRVFQYSEADRTTGELGSIWYPNVYDDRSLLSASLLAGDEGVGFRLNWQTTVLPGLFSNLELRDEPVATEFSDPGLQMRWTVSVDLAISGGRPIPARNDFIQSRAGSIGGRLLLGDGDNIRSEGIEQVAILIDGRPHTAVLRGKHFFVRNVPPGVYEVSLGAEFLPMSISPERISYRVRVVPAATTTVDFVVNREFGLGGRITDVDGAPRAGVPVEVLDSDGTLIQSTHTDGYGFYQFSGLVPDEYQLRVRAGEETVELSVTIEDDFVFDADLVLAALVADPDAAEDPSDG